MTDIEEEEVFEEVLEMEKKIDLEDVIIKNENLTDELIDAFIEHYGEDIAHIHLIQRSLVQEIKRLRGILGDYRRFHMWIGKKNYELIAEWDEMESEDE